MLPDLVEETCAKIDRLTLNEAHPALQRQVRQYAPEVASALMQQSRKRGLTATDEEALIGLSLLTLGLIKSLPPLARQMVRVLDDRRVASVRRLAVAGVLAYLVRPQDIIPDDAPGGYGFVDDAALLRAGLVEYLNLLPQGSANLENERQVVGLLVNLAPPQARPVLQQTIGAMSVTLQLMSMLEGPMAEAMLAQIIANPLQDVAPVAPQGFAPAACPDYSAGHWTPQGAYVEGGNIIMPGGGPALIDGQLFIP